MRRATAGDALAAVVLEEQRRLAGKPAREERRDQRLESGAAFDVDRRSPRSFPRRSAARTLSAAASISDRDGSSLRIESRTVVERRLARVVVVHRSSPFRSFCSLARVRWRVTATVLHESVQQPGDLPVSVSVEVAQHEDLGGSRVERGQGGRTLSRISAALARALPGLSVIAESLASPIGSGAPPCCGAAGRAKRWSPRGGGSFAASSARRAGSLPAHDAKEDRLEDVLRVRGVAGDRVGRRWKTRSWCCVKSAATSLSGGGVWRGSNLGDWRARPSPLSLSSPM